MEASPIDSAELNQSISVNVQIKGIGEGLLVHMGEGEWQVAKQALLDYVDLQQEFLRGARMALNVGNHVLKAVDLGQLRDELSERGISLWAVVSNSLTTEMTARILGLDTNLAKPRQEVSSETHDVSIQGAEEALLVNKTIRSGFRLQYAGHIIVVGDVNPGAEIIAGGNVIVWGHLRGLVHAGAEGNQEAVVCALDLHPTQLRIADQIAITPKRKGKPQPEIARLEDGKVVAEPWNPR